MALTVSLVAPDRRKVALKLLFARFPIDEQASRLDDALGSADRGCLNLDGLLLAEEDGQPVGAALMMRQNDGVALVWPPVTTCHAVDTAATEHAVMARLCGEIDRVDARLAQALIAPDDVAERELLETHGFHRAADMFFLARTVGDWDLIKAPSALMLADDEVDFELFNEANADRFATVIERTYRESLDCPFLDGFRSGKDALSSHRLSGTFDPAGWRLYKSGQEDIGVLLMNEHPEQNAIELVYFGIVPEFRGKRLGRRILTEGIQAAAITGRAAFFLAVDCENIYANRLYGELGFSEMARRQVMLRRSDRLARK